MPQVVSAYLRSILCVALCAFLCELILSGTTKSGKTLEKGLRLVTSLCMCISILMPVSEYITEFRENGLPDISDFAVESAFSPSEINVITLTQKQFEREISEKIYAKFGIQPIHISIDFDVEETENQRLVGIKGAHIVLSRKDAAIGESVRSYTAEILGVTPTTEYNGE